jgi:hypothetical protein
MLHSHALHAQRGKAHEAAQFLDDVDAVVYSCVVKGVWYARAFVGRAQNTAWNYRFKDEGQVKRTVEALHARLLKRAVDKKDRAEARKGFVHSLTVGTVLRSIWGYDQTNVDFFQVTKLIGTKMVEAREIHRDCRYTRSMEGKTKPRVGDFKGEPKRYRVTEGNCIRVYSFAQASPLSFNTVGAKKVYPACGFSETH